MLHWTWHYKIMMLGKICSVIGIVQVWKVAKMHLFGDKSEPIKIGCF